MSQNKELKANNVELQEAFVRLSNHNMELATELDSERRRLAQLKALQATPLQATPPPVSPPEAEPTSKSTPMTDIATGTPSAGAGSILNDDIEMVEGCTQTYQVEEDASNVREQISSSDAEMQRYTQVIAVFS